MKLSYLDYSISFKYFGTKAYLTVRDTPENTNEAILKEILKWIRIQGIAQAKPVLQEALKSEKEKLVYEYSDGERGIIELAKLTGLGQTTILRYWSKWAAMGIVEPIAVKGGTRYKKAFPLQTFGIEVPQLVGAQTMKEGAVEAESNSEVAKM